MSLSPMETMGIFSTRSQIAHMFLPSHLEIIWKLLIDFPRMPLDVNIRVFLRGKDGHFMPLAVAIQKKSSTPQTPPS